MISALYVATGGCYFGLDNVDPWDIKRDARLYAGPHPVVAHSPCARWCRLAKLVESQGGRGVGDDDGCFAAALGAVRRWGGVLEHPAWSLAWTAFGLQQPPARGWLRDVDGGWVCEVSQAAYGHKAEKLTWLYAYGVTPPTLDWSRPEPETWLTECRRRGDGTAMKNTRVGMKRSIRSATPPPFRDLLISIAESAKRRTEAA